MENNKLEFVVFLLNKYAETFGLSVQKVYRIFSDTKLLDNYIIKHYDVLHTLGENYLLEDLHLMITKQTGNR